MIPLSMARDDQWGLLTQWFGFDGFGEVEFEDGVGGVEEELLQWPMVAMGTVRFQGKKNQTESKPNRL